jgi:hypothetical protein
VTGARWIPRSESPLMPWMYPVAATLRGVQVPPPTRLFRTWVPESYIGQGDMSAGAPLTNTTAVILSVVIPSRRRACP